MSELVIVANRLPVQAPARGRGPWTRSPGGLAAALDPALAAHGGTWIGWPGGKRVSALPTDLGYRVEAVDIDGEQLRGYYDGFSNATLWPLYHDLVRQPVYRRDWWQDYQRVNARFAEAAAREAPPGSWVWVHDYQLQLVPGMLRRLRPDLRIGFFLHIPFPSADLFARLPWRRAVIEGIAGADVIGFQTPRDVENFRRAADRIASSGRCDGPHPLAGRLVDAFPISVDVDRWEEIARDPEVNRRAAELRSQLGNPGAILLGVDRLDYTKGIEHRLGAFRELLEDGSLSVPDAVMVQVASPSRDRTAAYRTERGRIEQMVGEINGAHGHVGAPAVHYIHRSLEPIDVAALYRAADVMLVTPIADGMNLVAKEFVATRVENTGALVLSEFAGAAHELTDAILVNPHDIDGLKAGIRQALEMSPDEARQRMSAMRGVIGAQTVHDWAEQFLACLVPEPVSV